MNEDIKDINDLLCIICNKKSDYYQIMLNITNDESIIPELISEIAVSYLSNTDKINSVIQSGWIKFFFIRTVLNQIKSSTSPLYKYRNIQNNEFIDNFLNLYDSEDTIEEKKTIEQRYIQIDKGYVRVPKTYFEEYIFQEYFKKGKTYREIAKDMNVSHSLVFIHLKDLLKKIRKKIDELN
ncbi:MAG: sigma-70 family RNA polymerase sigma factor [Caulobacteraceae bacterium]|nr:sigma-70 family RNA polymerase sigma factor [Caulobacteraceae bacterium]